MMTTTMLVAMEILVVIVVVVDNLNIFVIEKILSLMTNFIYIFKCDNGGNFFLILL